MQIKEATMLELMGNGTEALNILDKGQTLYSQQGSSFLIGRFHAAIGKIHRKSQDLKLATESLKQAEIQLNHITSRRCKLLLQVEIGQEYSKRNRKGLCSHNNKYDIVKGMLQLESKNGCKCWKRSYGFSLLSFLTEKGKDYILKDDTLKAKDVFMEIINLVLTFSSESQAKLTNFVEFFEYVETSELKFAHGTQVAHIICLISWAAYKISMNQSSVKGTTQRFRQRFRT